MSRRNRQSRREIIEKSIPISDWPQPVMNGLTPAKEERYWRNRTAVEMYAGGLSAREILKDTGINLKRAAAMFRSGGSFNERLQGCNGYFVCLEGWKPPSGYCREKDLPSHRTARNKGMAGALSYLFSKFPAIKDALLELVHNRTYRRSEPEETVFKVNILSVKAVYKEFLYQCRKAGISPLDYPFNTSHRGYNAVNEWMKQELNRAPVAKADNLYGESAKKDTQRALTAATSPTKNPQEIAYGTVQLDGHRHDSEWMVEVDIKGQTFVFPVAIRPWVVALIDQSTKAAQSALLTFEAEYSGIHLLRVFRQAFEPWSPLDLSEYEGWGFEYAAGAGFPSMFPEFAWNRPRDLAWDRKSSHVVASKKPTIRSVLGVHCAGMEAAGEPAVRGEIEGFFDVIATEARQLPSATGRHTKDPARRNAEQAAIKYHMNQTHACRYLDVLLANYNATPVRAAGGLSPLEQLKQCSYEGRIYLNPIPEIERAQVLWQLLPQFQGNLNRTKKKTGYFYVELHGARYTGIAIALNMGLLRYEKAPITLYVEDDARFAHLVVPEPGHPVGRYIGKIEVATKRWRHPHSIEERIYFNRFGREALAEYKTHDQNPTLALYSYLAYHAKNNPKAAAVLAEAAAKRMRFQKDEPRQMTDEELDISNEVNADDPYEPSDASVPALAVYPSNPPSNEITSFGGRIRF